MKNLIRGHIYQLKKDRFFLGCLAFALVFLGISIRVSSFGTGFVSGTGLENMFHTFLNGNVVLYAFMLLTANMIAESYHSGAIKNIVGRGINKKELLFFYHCYYICGIFAGNACLRHHYGQHCFCEIWHGKPFLPGILCFLRCCARLLYTDIYQFCGNNDNSYNECYFRIHHESAPSLCSEGIGVTFWIFENPS